MRGACSARPRATRSAPGARAARRCIARATNGSAVSRSRRPGRLDPAHVDLDPGRAVAAVSSERFMCSPICRRIRDSWSRRRRPAAATARPALAGSRPVRALDVQRRVLGARRLAPDSMTRARPACARGRRARCPVDLRRGRCRARRRSAGRPASSAGARRAGRAAGPPRGAAGWRPRCRRGAAAARGAAARSVGGGRPSAWPRRPSSGGDPRQHGADLDRLADLRPGSRRPRRRPGAGTSVSILSVEISQIVSSACDPVAELACHATTVPSATDTPIWGIVTSTSASQYARSSRHASLTRSTPGSTACSSGGENGIGTSGVATRTTGPSRSSKPALGDQRRDLRAGRAGRVGLVDDHDLRAARDRVEDRLLVERHQRAQVEHLDRGAVEIRRSPRALRAPSRRRRSRRGRIPAGRSARSTASRTRPRAPRP